MHTENVWPQNTWSPQREGWIEKCGTFASLQSTESFHNKTHWLPHYFNSGNQSDQWSVKGCGGHCGHVPSVFRNCGFLCRFTIKKAWWTFKGLVIIFQSSDIAHPKQEINKALTGDVNTPIPCSQPWKHYKHLTTTTTTTTCGLYEYRCSKRSDHSQTTFSCHPKLKTSQILQCKTNSAGLRAAGNNERKQPHKLNDFHYISKSSHLVSEKKGEAGFHKPSLEHRQRSVPVVSVIERSGNNWNTHLRKFPNWQAYK